MKRIVLPLVLLLSCSALFSAYGHANALPSSQVSSSAQKLPLARPLVRRSPGVYDEQLLRQHADGSSAESLRFVLSVPENDLANAATPLVVALHYSGNITPFFAEDMFYDLIDPALADLNALVILPDALSNDWTTPANEAALLQLIASIQAAYQIDTNRILLTGYSLGGTGAWYLGQRHQALFSAILPISGMPPAPEQATPAQQKWQIPIYAIHSLTDQVSSVTATRDYIMLLQASGSDATLVTLEQANHYDFAAFTDALYQAIPWIESIWKQPE
ncbi:hypothetical protein EZV61_11450 [Corallincola luteus]|uniref:Phospholipase/carboxylesterase/thioesterase domain-containing protein n=1 Tax=Corallincola luteus TaxID=1775177 RepID=A0ABY2AJE5_9GAMM|nr:dienelactone hydrolase family protein [Corallincola luteus]TCI02903.1 hypothetical protein EZV61_11450 [Corallincola luteus]